MQLAVAGRGVAGGKRPSRPSRARDPSVLGIDVGGPLRRRRRRQHGGRGASVAWAPGTSAPGSACAGRRRGMPARPAADYDVELDVETTRDEIVDVAMTGARRARASCLVEKAAWRTRRDRRFGKTRRHYMVAWKLACLHVPFRHPCWSPPGFGQCRRPARSTRRSSPCAAGSTAFHRRDAGVTARVLPVTFAAATPALIALLDELEPALVICTGEADRPAVCVERIAINVADARIADNAGAQPIDAAIQAARPGRVLVGSGEAGRCGRSPSAGSRWRCRKNWYVGV